MGRIRIVNIVGARPNLMKMAPLMWAMNKSQCIEPVLVHTGQHYDPSLSDIFFEQLDIRPPDYSLGVGSGSHSYQTAQIMLKLEPLLKEIKPALVLVVGDVNSTVASALVATKLHIFLAHVEAGLRSFDRTMPEEINRVVTDSVSHMLFVTEQSGVGNLCHEGVDLFLNEGRPIQDISEGIWTDFVASEQRGFSTRFGAFVGNVMIDTLLAIKEKAEEEAEIDLPGKDYALLTMHRPSNVDDPETFRRIASVLCQLSKEIPIFFPCHPRTQKRIEEFGLVDSFVHVEGCSTSSLSDSKIMLLDPLGYFEFLKLMAHAKLVLTDSGGIQEETTILGVPCLTIRENTERPVTLTEGSNTLVGTDPERIIGSAREVLHGNGKKGGCPVLWDGKAAERIVSILELMGRLPIMS
ncbi:MAG: UDP-N-acetyl glucosamine 2-epimerase [bacterium]